MGKDKVKFISFDDVEPLLDWVELTDYIIECHNLEPAIVSDQIIQSGANTLLSWATWINELGSLVKTALVVPANRDREIPTIGGVVTLFDQLTGELMAVLDFHLVTKWKTAADSLLAARNLARPNSSSILIIGAGTVAQSIIEAYSSVYSKANFSIWNRAHSKAQIVAQKYRNLVEIQPVEDLEIAVNQADIITCATMSSNPVINGNWLSPGTHIDLIGAYRIDMREADDVAIRRSRIFVDSRDTTINHIGEIKIPMDKGIICKTDIIADFYEIVAGKFMRISADEITLFKNGGGAHLDLMTTKYILTKWNLHR